MVKRLAPLRNKYQNTSRQRRRILLRRLDNGVMRPDIDPDVFLSEVFQLRDELNDLGEVITNKRFTIIILDALPDDMYFTVKMKSTRDPELGLEEIIGMMKTILIDHSDMLSAPKRSQESYR